ncbi:MAG: peptidoglycan bridge formation glycyltransferase FemA/FemB family protein [Candidatus Komeilibacteria bacterium]
MEVSLNIRPNQEFLDRFPIGAFLQSRFWAEVLKQQGIKSWQLNVFQNHQVIGQCLLYSHKLPFGKAYLYSGKGPLISLEHESELREAFGLFLTQIRDITIATAHRQEIFCRLEPSMVPPQLEIPFVPAAPVQPQLTSLLNLRKSEEEIFQKFKEKTRYNIRLAERKGVTVHWGTSDQALKIFLDLLPRTQLRQRIRSHTNRHYRAIVNAGREHNTVKIAWAEYQGQPIAANLYILFGSTVTYLHGAFNYHYREVMAPHLLQWQGIKQAAYLGYKYFDFWGLAPSDGSQPSWDGFTRFKRGFNGIEISHPGAFDFIYNDSWYTFYQRVRKVRRLLRRT